MLALGELGGAPAVWSKAAGLPPPNESGIEHVVLLMMENRSFDHYLGWLDGADGRQRGLKYVDRDGGTHRTQQLSEFQGCGHPDPDHSFEGGRLEYNNGACDGWLRAGENDDFAIGFYTRKDLAFLGDAAPRWTVADRYFCSIMAPTFPNRIYQHAAQTDRLTNTLELSALTTIWDLLAGAGVEGRYYFSDVPLLALWGARYLGIGRPFSDFLADAAAGTLPSVSFVEPRFLGAELGLSADDHPFADIRNGQAFLDQVYRAVTASPNWPNTLLIVNYDEWGGFFDHVPPPIVSDVPDQAVGNDGRLGFRVPFLAVSPFARREHVSHLVLDHTSVLRTIEWRWGLPSLTSRDANANNVAEILDFEGPSLRAKQFEVPAGPFGEPCVGARVAAEDQWDRLRQMADGYGWPR